MHQNAGFTLIELLIVIAIIGILAVVMLPNLLMASRRAYDTSAVSCATSLAKAVSIYRIDHPNQAVTPTLSQIYGTPTINQEFGTDNCNQLTLQDVSQASAYKFTIKHPQGKNTYTVSDTGITTS